MKTLSTIQAMQKWRLANQAPDASPDHPPVPDQVRQLLEVVRLYRKQEEDYYSKVKRKEFAKDELHHLMKTKQKLDNLLLTIQL